MSTTETTDTLDVLASMTEARRRANEQWRAMVIMARHDGHSFAAIAAAAGLTARGVKHIVDHDPEAAAGQVRDMRRELARWSVIDGELVRR